LRQVYNIAARNFIPQRRQGAKFRKVEMEKLYVNAIGPEGDVSTVGLFYSRPEAQKIIDMLRANPERSGYRYEIVEAVRHVLSEKDSLRTRS